MRGDEEERGKEGRPAKEKSMKDRALVRHWASLSLGFLVCDARREVGLVGMLRGLSSCCQVLGTVPITLWAVTNFYDCDYYQAHVLGHWASQVIA